MENSNNKIVRLSRSHTVKAILLFFFVIIVFAAGFSKIEGLDFFNSIYWAITTSSTVGYGDFAPTTTLGKILTMFTMFSGIGLLGYILSQVSNHIISYNMKNIMGIAKSNKKDHTIILAWNVVAKNAIQELIQEENDIVVVDESSQPEINTYPKTQFILGVLNEPKTLIRAGIRDAKQIILTMPKDSKVILGISLIRKLNSKILIIGRIGNIDFSNVAYAAGCNRVVSPSEVGGNLIYSALVEPSVVKWVSEVTTQEHGASLSELNIKYNSQYVGKKIKEIKFYKNTLVTAISRGSKIESVPDENYILTSDDTLILVQKDKSVKGLDRIHKTDGKTLNGLVLICGWNHTLRSTINELLNTEKIIVLANNIEKGEKRHYKDLGVKFFEGEVNKFNLIKADVSKVSTVILGMRDDSDVILMSYMVKELNPGVNLITRIDEATNNSAAYTAGTNHIVSPSEIGGRLLAHSIKYPMAVNWIMGITTLSIGAKIKEIKVIKNKKYIGKKISELELPKNTQLVGLDEDSNSVVESLPNKNYVLKKSDTLVVVQK